MATAKVMRRYQIVIPREIRRKVRIKEGDQVEVEYVEGKIVVTPVRGSSERAVRENFGAFRQVSATTVRRALKEPERGLLEED